MAGGLLGIDVTAAEDLSRVMNSTADTFDTEKNQLTTMLMNVTWHGPDAENFKSEWNSNSVRNLQLIIDMLRQAGTALYNQAQAQRQVSGAG